MSIFVDQVEGWIKEFSGCDENDVTWKISGTGKVEIFLKGWKEFNGGKDDKIYYWAEQYMKGHNCISIKPGTWDRWVGEIEGEVIIKSDIAKLGLSEYWKWTSQNNRETLKILLEQDKQQKLKILELEEKVQKLERIVEEVYAPGGAMAKELEHHFHLMCSSE